MTAYRPANYTIITSPEIIIKTDKEWILALRGLTEKEIEAGLSAFTLGAGNLDIPRPRGIAKLARASGSAFRSAYTHAKNRLLEQPPVAKTDEQKAIADDLVKNLFKGVS